MNLRNKKGLYARINDKWCPIPPKPGYIVVNFGKAFELLVNDRSKLVAAWHVVEQITKEKHGGDRISFGFFSNNTADAEVKSISSAGTLKVLYSRYDEYVEHQIKTVKNNVTDVPKFEQE